MAATIAVATQSPTAMANNRTLWEECYRLASQGQQQEMLALARSQGLLYSHQLAGSANGSVSLYSKSQLASTSHLPEILQRLLNTQHEASPSLLAHPAEPLDLADGALDGVQRAAVARALASPDISLLQGEPGTGKSRVLIEILVQAARRGWRTLFVAQHPASVDTVLERLAGSDLVCPIRLAEPGEQVSASVQPLLLQEGRHGFLAAMIERARAGQQQSEAACQNRHQQESRFAHLESLIDAYQRAQGSLHTLRIAHDHLPREIRRLSEDASSELGRHINELFAASQSTLAPLQGELDEIEAKKRQLDSELVELESDIQSAEGTHAARRSGKWWTAGWWRALLGSNSAAVLEELRVKKEGLHTAQALLAAKRRNLEETRLLAETAFEEEREKVVLEEIRQRGQDVTEREQSVHKECMQIVKDWVQRCSEIAADEPGTPCAVDLNRLRSVWEEQSRFDEENCQFAQRWLKFIESQGEHLADRFPSLANLYAGTLTAWQKQSAIESADGSGLFDLLIVEDAHEFTEADLMPLMGQAIRCLLVGQGPDTPFRDTETSNGRASISGAAHPAGAQASSTRTSSSRNMPRTMPGRVAPELSPPFHRLCQSLHTDPSQLPYRWFEENNRLGCQLRPVEPHQASSLEIESLADLPDIELRILSVPGQTPQLVQVLFPAGMALAEAKTFIYRELQEVPMCTSSHNAWLEATATRWTLRFGPPACADAITLDAGLTEWVAGRGSSNSTYCFDFDRSRWTLPQVHAWIDQHLGFCESGRSTQLSQPQRMQPGLANWLADVLGCRYSVSQKHDADEPESTSTACVEFIPVPAPPLPAPSLPAPDNKRDSQRDGKLDGRQTVKPLREGAGLEVEMSGRRSPDRIPVELMNGLPREGYINYLEAQAVIKELRCLVEQPQHASASIAVLAFQSAQVELLRRLIDLNEGLKDRVQVGLPEMLRGRESDIVVISLTRSSKHRTGSFAAAWSDVQLAMTRCRFRLILIGDPGTLFAWNSHQESIVTAKSYTGASHTGAPRGEPNPSWVAQLCRYLGGKGSCQTAFRLRLGV